MYPILPTHHVCARPYLNCAQLNLRYHKLGPEGATALAPAIAVCASLTSLSTAHNDISGDGAQQLAAVVLAKPTLEVFSGIPLKELRTDSLTSLDLNSKGLGVPEATVLADLLRSVSASLTECNFLNNSFGVKGWTIIFNALRDSSTSKFTTWDLSYERLGPEIAKPLAEYISATTSITSVRSPAQTTLAHSPSLLLLALLNMLIVSHATQLNLSENKLGPEGAAALAPAIAAMGSVTECNLHNNDLGVEGWTIIFNSLRDSPTSKIAMWDLSNEYLGPEIAKPLADYISVTASITSVR